LLDRFHNFGTLMPGAGAIHPICRGSEAVIQDQYLRPDYPGPQRRNLLIGTDLNMRLQGCTCQRTATRKYIHKNCWTCVGISKLRFENACRNHWIAVLFDSHLRTIARP
jgi:hypothetical protein